MSNRIIIAHQSKIQFKNTGNGETISVDIGSDDPIIVGQGTNGTFYTGGNFDYTNKNKELDIFKPLFDLIENIFDSTTRNFGCENPNHRRGWIFNGIIPEFAECGCYIESFWPAAFGVLAGGAVSVATKTIINKTRRVLFKKFLEKLQVTVQAKRLLRISWLGAKKVGVDPLATFAEQAFSLPPVAPGFTRYYRAQGTKGLSELANNLDPKGGGRWFSDDLNYVLNYISEELVPYPTEYRGKYPNGHVVYIDLPTGSVANVIDDQRYQLLINVQAYDQETRQYVISSQARLRDWRSGDIILRKLPLKRKNINGGIDIIFDTPKSSDIALNPGIFVGSLESGSREFFFDSSIANNAKKIAACDNLADIDEFDKVFEKLDQFAWCEDENGNKTLAFRVVNNNEYNLLGNNSKLARGIDLRSKDVQLGEKLISDEQYRNAKFAEFDSIIEEFEKLRTDHLDETPPTISNLIDELKDLVGPGSQIRNLIDRSLQIFLFIETVLNAIGVVEIKKCNPNFLNTDSISSENTDDIYNGNTFSQYDKLKLTAIANKLPIKASLNPDTCECSVCPDDYSLCDKSSIFNVRNPLIPWDDRWNTCFPECCGQRKLSDFQEGNNYIDCNCQCDQYEIFLPCESSDCFSHVNPPSYLATWLNGKVSDSPFAKKPFRGKCAPINPNENKLLWNSNKCEYECMDYEWVFPNLPPIRWAGGGGVGGVPPIKIKKKYKPCPQGQIRLPPNCECGYPEETTPTPTIITPTPYPS